MNVSNDIMKGKQMLKLFKKNRKPARYHWRPAVNMNDRQVVNTLINPMN